MKHLLVLSIATLALVAAGCGSDNSSSSDTSGSSSSGTSSSSSSSTGAAKSGAVAVDIKGFAFNPARLTVKRGAKITWTNDDSTAHNVMSDDGTFESKTLNQGDTFSYTADTPGTFDYVCTFHPNMQATLTVTD